MQATPRVRSPVPGILLLGVGIALSWALVGLPMIGIGAGQLLAWAHRDPESPGSDTRVLAAGWVAVLILGAAVVTGGVLGVCAIELVEDAFASSDRAFLATAVIAPLSAGVLFAPLAFAPSLALQESKAAWLVESVWLSAHRGALRTMMVGLGLGGHGALPFALAWGCLELVDDDLAPLALLAGVGLTVVSAPISLRMLADAFVSAREQAADAAHAERALGALGRLAVGPLAVLGIVIAFAAWTPSRLRMTDGVTPTEPAPIRVPGTDFSVDGDWRSVRVLHDDGRAREHAIDGYLYDARGRVDRVRYRGREAWRVEIGNTGRAYELVLDDDGERLGDGLAVRLDSRTPGVALLLLALGCALGVAFAVRSGRVRATVRTLALVIRHRGGHDVITGALALRGSAPRVVSGALLGGAGGAIESDGGAIRIALPDTPVVVLASDPSVPAQLEEGTQVTLVSRGARLGGVGLRDAAAPFPTSGALVIGDPERGRAALVRASFPTLVRLGLAIGGFVVAATMVIAASTG